MKPKLHRSVIICLMFFSCSCIGFPKQINRVNVKDFGAKGDGLTDDTDAIRKAFASLAVTGGYIDIPKGIYLTNCIDIRPKKGCNISVNGDRSGSVIRLGKQFIKPVAVFFCEIPDVTLLFNNITIDGNFKNRTLGWRTTGKKQAEIHNPVNGIFVYNVSKLTVINCVIKEMHGDGIAAYSTNGLLANNNNIKNISGSGIKGHRVNNMEVHNNQITNSGMMTDNYVLDGKPMLFSSRSPHTKFGDGIESASKTFTATKNVIINSGRCGIVHDLAKDLNFENSTAVIRSNKIVVNSKKINSNNPPAGMWFEQTSTVIVDRNEISIIKSGNKITSAIRFYDITNKIECSRNSILAKSYDKPCDNAIGVFEPNAKKIFINNNDISGSYRNSIVVSYEKKFSKLSNLSITENNIHGEMLVNSGISINVGGECRFPDLTVIASNKILGIKSSPYELYFYGNTRNAIGNSAINFRQNITDNNFKNYKLVCPPGVDIIYN